MPTPNPNGYQTFTWFQIEESVKQRKYPPKCPGMRQTQSHNIIISWELERRDIHNEY